VKAQGLIDTDQASNSLNSIVPELSASMATIAAFSCFPESFSARACRYKVASSELSSTPLLSCGREAQFQRGGLQGGHVAAQHALALKQERRTASMCSNHCLALRMAGVSIIPSSLPDFRGLSFFFLSQFSTTRGAPEPGQSRITTRTQCCTATRVLNN
jgi:hypothetical protein